MVDATHYYASGERLLCCHPAPGAVRPPSTDKEVVTMPNIAAWLNQPQVLNVTGGIAMALWAAMIVGGIAYLFAAARSAR